MSLAAIFLRMSSTTGRALVASSFSKLIRATGVKRNSNRFAIARGTLRRLDTAQIAAKISFNDGAADLGLLPISDF